ncbi:elongation factor G [Candidatus Oleimmundimicrobium sp.]|uniref:elongation factor G n=1 Tax=Candidatus Oleimmundimicrobium sp. TaxID=3060597 RepID=UPI0027250B8D|nr:elongation factor G [Candidatus Oleimmundimicrobium sp.]MDO8885689.1 elongation factor G [Candidatus Oleimmundimicrobium sp.]
MGEITTSKIRNVSLVAHGGTGKTSLAEAALFTSQAINRLGKVDDGTTVTDYDPEEIKRKISTNSTLAYLEWRSNKINLIDTPGYADFIGEVKAALRVSDAAIVLVDGLAGVKVQTEIAWKMADERNLPRLVFINKMDKENASFEKALESLKKTFKNSFVTIQLPIGANKDFKGIIDIIKMRSLTFKNGKVTEDAIPDNLKPMTDKYAKILTEAVAETDDNLLTKYLEEKPLSSEEILEGLKKATKSGQIVPILCGSATENIGINPLLDTIIDYLPSPDERPAAKGTNLKTKEEETCKPIENEPLSALVFKTLSDPYIGKLNFARIYSGTLKADSEIYNSTTKHKEKVSHLLQVIGKEQKDIKEAIAGDIVAIPKLSNTHTGDTLCDELKPIVFEKMTFPEPIFSIALEPKSKNDDGKLGTSLNKLTEEDPTFKVKRDHETGQTIISGMGNVHLEVKVSKLKQKFGVEAITKDPKIAYKETIRGTSKVQGKYKKQSGGHGQYGDVWIEFKPLPHGAGFEFEDKIFGGSVPKQYIPAVEKGLIEALDKGVLAGYPVVGIKAILYDGSYHPVDSSEMAFKVAASMAFKKGIQEATPVILEPILNVEVTVPQEYMGTVIGDLNSKRGKILGMEPIGNGYEIVKARVPKAEMKKYAPELRSMAHGRATFSFKFASYEEAPHDIQEKIIAEAKKEKE